MRQVGVLAGPGLIALREMPARLERDHAMATLLAARLSKVEGLELEYAPRTNMLHFSLSKAVAKTPVQIEEELKALGVLTCSDPQRWRLVTHYHVDESAVEQVADAFAKVLQGAIKQ